MEANCERKFANLAYYAFSPIKTKNKQTNKHVVGGKEKKKN